VHTNQTLLPLADAKCRQCDCK